jgi:hypothetical protein
MFLSGTGNLGVGNNAPIGKLDVNTAYNVHNAPGVRVNSWVDMSSSACGLAEVGTNVYLSSDNTLQYSNTHGTAGAAAIMFRDCGADYQAIKFLRAAGATTANANASMAESMRIDSSGRVGIGTSTPGYLLHVNGPAAGISWTNLSSRSYKEDLRRVTPKEEARMLQTLLGAQLTKYRYKKEYGGADGQAHLGFIAEEMPAAVLSPDGKGVDVYELVTYTIGAMKAQQTDFQVREREWRAERAAMAGELAEMKRELHRLSAGAGNR